jgi:hypothetical protein
MPSPAAPPRHNSLRLLYACTYLLIAADVPSLCASGRASCSMRKAN